MDIGTSKWQNAVNQPIHMAEIAIRSTALLFDFQVQAARDLLEMQARSAAVFGIPDCSSLFNTADERARRLFTEGAEHLLNSTRRANETMAEMNRHLGRLVEQQTVGIAEQVRQGIDQLGRHTEQGLQQARDLVEHGVEELARAAQEARQQASEQPGWQQQTQPSRSIIEQPRSGDVPSRARKQENPRAAAE